MTHLLPSTLRAPFALILLASLSLLVSACGGGGGGGNSSPSPAGTPAPTTPSTPTPTLPPTTPSDPTPPPSPPTNSHFITVQPASLAFRTFQSSSYEAQSQTLAVTFQGEGVLVGYPPGVTPPPWLLVEEETIQAPSQQFELPISVRPPHPGLGTYSTTLRLVTGSLTTGASQFVDVPIGLTILPQPTIYTGTVAFSASTSGASAPPARSIALDFGVFTDNTFTVTLRDENSIASSWLAATPSAANRTILLSVHERPVGVYSASLIVQYQANGATGTAFIPVRYDVTAGVPQIDYVVPEAIYTDVPSESILRGAGFTRSSVESITLESVPASSFEVVNDTEIVARFAAGGTAGSASLQVDMADPTLSLTHSVLVKERPPAIPANLDLGEHATHARFDSATDAIIIAGPQTLFRIHLSGGSWQVATQRALSIGSFDLSPDARFIVFAQGNTIRTLDAVTLQDVNSYALPEISHLGPPGYDHSAVKQIMNNGQVLLGLYGPGSGLLFIFDLTNQTLKPTYRNIYLSMIKRDARRTRAFIAANLLGGQDFNGYYFASDGSYLGMPLPGDAVASNRFALSADATRLILDDNLYEDNALLSTLIDSSIWNYSSELSADGQRAYFVKAGDGVMHQFDISGEPPYSSTVYTTFPAYDFYAAFPSTLVTPDGGTMVLHGGAAGGSATETRLTVVPLP